MCPTVSVVHWKRQACQILLERRKYISTLHVWLGWQGYRRQNYLFHCCVFPSRFSLQDYFFSSLCQEKKQEVGKITTTALFRCPHCKYINLPFSVRLAIHAQNLSSILELNLSKFAMQRIHLRQFTAPLHIVPYLSINYQWMYFLWEGIELRWNFPLLTVHS